MKVIQKNGYEIWEWELGDTMRLGFVNTGVFEPCGQPMCWFDGKFQKAIEQATEADEPTAIVERK